MAASRERSLMVIDAANLGDGLLGDEVMGQLRTLTVEAVAAELEQRQPTDAVGQLARGVSEAETLAVAFARLTRQLPRGLAWRANGMADHLRSGLERYFPREDRA